MKIIMKVRSGKYITSIPVTVEENEKEYWFWFAYNPALVSEMGVMAGAKWMPEEKLWRVNNDERNQYALKYLVGERDERYYNNNITTKPYTNSSVDRNLFDHQKEGIDFILSRKRCMLAFEMGLGKTVQPLAYLSYHPEKFPVLFVVKSGVKFQFFNRFFNKYKMPAIDLNEMNSGATS